MLSASEQARQLVAAREHFLTDDRPVDEATDTFERVVDRIFLGHEVYILGLETEREWR